MLFPAALFSGCPSGVVNRIPAVACAHPEIVGVTVMLTVLLVPGDICPSLQYTVMPFVHPVGTVTAGAPFGNTRTAKTFRASSSWIFVTVTLYVSASPTFPGFVEVRLTCISASPTAVIVLVMNALAVPPPDSVATARQSCGAVSTGCTAITKSCDWPGFSSGIEHTTVRWNGPWSKQTTSTRRR